MIKLLDDILRTVVFLIIFVFIMGILNVDECALGQGPRARRTLRGCASYLKKEANHGKCTKDKCYKR